MNAIELSTDKLLTDLKQVVRDSEELLQSTAGAVGDRAQEVRERLATALENAKRTCRKLENDALDAAKVTEELVREHPYQSMGVAFGIGLLAGVLVTRK